MAHATARSEPARRGNDGERRLGSTPRDHLLASGRKLSPTLPFCFDQPTDFISHQVTVIEVNASVAIYLQVD